VLSVDHLSKKLEMLSPPMVFLWMSRKWYVQSIICCRLIWSWSNIQIDVKEADVVEFLSQQTRPVIVIFHDISSDLGVSRRLQQDLNGTEPLTEFEIASYQVRTSHTIVLLLVCDIFLVQIAGWVGICFLLLLLTGVCMIVTMDVVPDSLLFAKFQSSRTNKSD
jgi:hypothetical protein